MPAQPGEYTGVSVEGWERRRALLRTEQAQGRGSDAQQGEPEDVYNAVALALRCEMFLNFGIILNAILFALGVVWCKEIFGRFRSELARFRITKDSAEKGVIVFFWVLTAVILLLMVNFAGGLVMNFASGRGKSLHRRLREFIPREYWKGVVVGLCSLRRNDGREFVRNTWSNPLLR
jgi:hypothetical protein